MQYTKHPSFSVDIMKIRTIKPVSQEKYMKSIGKGIHRLCSHNHPNLHFQATFNHNANVFKQYRQNCLTNCSGSKSYELIGADSHIPKMIKPNKLTP